MCGLPPFLVKLLFGARETPAECELPEHLQKLLDEQRGDVQLTDQERGRCQAEFIDDVLGE